MKSRKITDFTSLENFLYYSSYKDASNRHRARPNILFAQEVMFRIATEQVLESTGKSMDDLGSK